MLRQQLLLNMAMIGFVHGRTIAVFYHCCFMIQLSATVLR